MQGYAYIMTHPGTPTIFWDHLFEWPELKQPLLDLIKLRKEVGIKCRSGVKILCAEQAVYAAEIFDEGGKRGAAAHHEDRAERLGAGGSDDVGVRDARRPVVRLAEAAIVGG